jgi:hypothetical protein
MKIGYIVVSILIVLLIPILLILTIIIWLLTGSWIHPHQAINVILLLIPLIFIVRSLLRLCGGCVLGCQEVSVDTAVDL